MTTYWCGTPNGTKSDKRPVTAKTVLANMVRPVQNITVEILRALTIKPTQARTRARSIARARAMAIGLRIGLGLGLGLWLL